MIQHLGAGLKGESDVAADGVVLLVRPHAEGQWPQPQVVNAADHATAADDVRTDPVRREEHEIEWNRSEGKGRTGGRSALAVDPSLANPKPETHRNLLLNQVGQVIGARPCAHDRHNLVRGHS